eukprot:Ihof_evm15s136 gene=Ihof_evmTU15s136
MSSNSDSVGSPDTLPSDQTININDNDNDNATEDIILLGDNDINIDMADEGGEDNENDIIGEFGYNTLEEGRGRGQGQEEMVAMETDDQSKSADTSLLSADIMSDIEGEKVEQPTLDLETYIHSYSGMTKIQRLVLIGQRAPSLAFEALSLALLEIKNSTISTCLYRDVHAQMERVCLASNQVAPKLDLQWINQTDRDACEQLDQQERDIKSNRNKQIKSSIRLGYIDMGDFYYKRGDPIQALKYYLRTRDYCSSPDDLIYMCICALNVSLQMKNWSQVLSYCQRAETTPDFAADRFKLDATRIKCMTGLGQLANKRYRLAALSFLDVSADLCGNMTDVISLADIGLYGGLCALASFDRRDLKKSVIDNVGFKLFLENMPILRELISDFYNCRYGACLEHLNTIRSDCLLDMHLYSHVNELYSNIRKKALVQYFSPYLSVDLSIMARCFNTDLIDLQKELVTLIGEEVIQARIDSHNKIMYVRHVDQRSTTYEKALEMGEKYR